MGETRAIFRKATCRPHVRQLALLLSAFALLSLVLAGCSSQNNSSTLSENANSSGMQVSDNTTIAPVDYANNIEAIYQNELGLYSGCEIVSLAMVLNSMGIDVDPHEIASKYVEYASYGNYYSGYGYSSYYGYGNSFSSGYNTDFPPLDNRRDAIDSMDDIGPYRGDSSADAGSREDADRNTADSGTSSTQNSSIDSVSSSPLSQNTDQSLGNGETKSTKLTDFYIGDPYYSGMAYPSAIAKIANKILKDHNSPLKAVDQTGLSLYTLLRYVEAGYPVITWVTLDYSSPLVSWAPEGMDNVLWYDNLHCVVLFGYDKTTDTVTVADPLQGIIEMPREEFEIVFEECGNMSVTIL